MKRSKRTPARKRTVISVYDATGWFAEDKDIGRDLRTYKLIPALKAGDRVTIDFSGVHLATQSFIHAMLTEIIREHGASVLDSISFKSCNAVVKSLVLTVVEYSQETDELRR